MSRIGVVRWLPVVNSLNISTTNSSQPLLAWSPAKQEWIQMDLLTSLFVIVLVITHLHLCRLTKVGVSGVFALCCLSMTLLLAPIVTSVLLLFATYRYIITLFLKLSLGCWFAGLLHGNDTFWALEDDTSLSIINVLALTDFSFIVSASTQDDEPLHTISELIQDRLLTPPVPFPKLMWSRRQSRLGYFYWFKESTIDISTHIRWMNIEDQGNQTITESALKNFISSVTNSQLPSDHTAGWEILVGRYPIKPSSDLLDAMEKGGRVMKSCAGDRYPVLFRIHHSIGDGVALVNLLLDSLSDPYTRCNTPDLHRTSPTFNMNYVRPKTPTIPKEQEEVQVVSSWEEPDLAHYDANHHNGLKYPLLKSRGKVACETCFSLICENKTDLKMVINQSVIRDFDIVVNDRPSEEFIDLMHNAKNYVRNEYLSIHPIFYCKYVIQLLKLTGELFYKLVNFTTRLIQIMTTIGRQLSVILFAPALIVNQALKQIVDDNILHGPKLSGSKVNAWYFEEQDNSDQLLMSMIKRIRSKAGVRFSDVLLTAISESLEMFYSQGKEVPKYITVVIPARLGEPSYPSNKTKNGHGILSITCDDKQNQLENKFSVAMLLLPIATGGSGDVKLFQKLRKVQAHCDMLRGSPDYLINYWLLRVVATLLPCVVLRPLLRSTHSTLVLSNLPGPTRLTKLAGHTVHDLVFWVPNRSTTGVGLTALSYAGRLHLGLMIDRALVPYQKDAQLILDGVATAIQRMDHLLSPPEPAAVQTVPWHGYSVSLHSRE